VLAGALACAAGPPPQVAKRSTHAPAAHAPPAATPISSNTVAEEPPEPPLSEPPPQREEARFVALEVPDFLDAVVSLPGGLVRPEPVVLATHGAGGAPEHHCQAWREWLGSRGLVVCPRGAMINRVQGPSAGFYYPDHHALDREVSATVEALRREYADRIDGTTLVYAGYSQGATMGALILPEHADLFPRAVLVEGGFSEWSAAAANKFARGGGERVLFVCGVKTCKQGADRSAHILRRAELEVETKLAFGAGHTYLGAVAQEITEGFAWLVAGDARFRER